MSSPSSTSSSVYSLLPEGENNKDALSTLLKSFNFKDYLYLDDNNPLKCNLLMFAYLEDKPEMID